MSGPVAFGRQVAAVESFLQAQPDWNGLGNALFGGPAPDAFRPEDDVKKFLAAAFRTAQGRAFVDWLADLTVRSAPEPGGPSLEAAAMAHAKHETRWALGQAVFRALSEGNDLLNQRSQP